MVEPPVAITSATAFSIDFLVMMSRGFKSRLTASTSTRADSAAESAFSPSGDAICELPRRLNPNASNDDDIVFADFGPVFARWEADFGRTWVLGVDPLKQRLRDDLAEVFHAGKRFYRSRPGLSAAGLYAEMVRLSEERGWEFGNYHCGHLVGEFPHENFAGEKADSLITPANAAPLLRTDPSGRVAHWILEVHLVDRERAIGGFYEELLTI